MEVSHINAEHLIVSCCIVHIELMGTNYEGFTSDAKEFGLQSVTHKFAGIFGLKNLIKALLENGTIPELINSEVLCTIRNPSVEDTGTPLLLTNPCSYFSTTFCVLDPEPTDSLILACQGIAIISHWMAEEGSIEVQRDTHLLAPIKPTLIVLLLNLVTVNKGGTKLSIAGMQVQPMTSTNQGEDLLKILTQLFDSLCFAGIVPCGLDSSTSQFSIGTLETANIIALPTVDRDGNVRQLIKDRVGIDTIVRIYFLGFFIVRHDSPPHTKVFTLIVCHHLHFLP